MLTKPITYWCIVLICWLPWRRGLCHPHQVHITGENWQLSGQVGIILIARTPIGQEHVNQQLQVGLPPDRLPEQYDCYGNTGSQWGKVNKIRTSKNCFRSSSSFSLWQFIIHFNLISLELSLFIFYYLYINISVFCFPLMYHDTFCVF